MTLIKGLHACPFLVQGAIMLVLFCITGFWLAILTQ